jgi:hypothetical protein
MSTAHKPAQMRPAIGYQTVNGGTEETASMQFKWDGQPARPPRRGEYYLSGAIPEAWDAPNDLSTPFFICQRVSA